MIKDHGVMKNRMKHRIHSKNKTVIFSRKTVGSISTAYNSYFLTVFSVKNYRLFSITVLITVFLTEKTVIIGFLTIECDKSA